MGKNKPVCFLTTLILCIFTVYPLFAQNEWASSLWLNFRDATNAKSDILMIDLEVDSSAKSTYYAALNFTGGYAGVQDIRSSDKYRTVHFSLWDKVDATEGQMAEVVWKDFGIGSSRFGGEGEGVKTWYRFNWKEGQTYRLMVKITRKNGESFWDGWFFDFSAYKWKHLAILKRPGTEYFGNNSAFIEDWARTGQWYRSYYVFNARKRLHDTKKWFEFSNGEFWINGTNMNCDGRVIDNRFYLETGGTINQTNPSGTILSVETTPFNPQSPEIAEIHVEQADTNSVKVTWNYVDNLWAPQETCRLRIARDETIRDLVYESGTMTYSDQKYTIENVSLEPGVTYYIRVDMKNIFDFATKMIVPFKDFVVVSVKDNNVNIPGAMSLKQNYPNPFNPNTTIEYQLQNTSNVTVDVFDVMGKKVTSLVNCRQQAGGYQINWDGTDSLGEKTASGLYFYVLKAGDIVLKKKMTLMK